MQSKTISNKTEKHLTYHLGNVKKKIRIHLLFVADSIFYKKKKIH